MNAAADVDRLAAGVLPLASIIPFPDLLFGGSLLVAVVLLHFAIFPMNVLISARLFGVVTEGRSRVNTAVIAVNFIAGAIGSALVGPLWSAGGWHAVTEVGIGISAVGLLLWVIGRRGPLEARTD